jgi:hypothetical protein
MVFSDAVSQVLLKENAVMAEKDVADVCYLSISTTYSALVLYSTSALLIYPSIQLGYPTIYLDSQHHIEPKPPRPQLLPKTRRAKPLYNTVSRTDSI